MTFPRPFRLSGMDSEQPPGRYLVEIDEELLGDLSFPAYRRTATYLTLPRQAHGVISSEMIRVDATELYAVATIEGNELGLAGPPVLHGELDHRWPSRRTTALEARAARAPSRKG